MRKYVTLIRIIYYLWESGFVVYEIKLTIRLAVASPLAAKTRGYGVSRWVIIARYDSPRGCGEIRLASVTFLASRYLSLRVQGRGMQRPLKFNEAANLRV